MDQNTTQSPRELARKKRQAAALKANMKRRKEAAKEKVAEGQPRLGLATDVKDQ